MSIDLRCFTYIDILQPQTAGFLATVSQGYHPLESQASLFIEVSPGMDVNVVTDIALKQTSCTPGMQVVERRFGCLELHHYDQGQVRAAGEAILSALDLKLEDRLKRRFVSGQTINGTTGYHAQITNRMRHGNFLNEGETLYVLETHPAGYALIANNKSRYTLNTTLHPNSFFLTHCLRVFFTFKRLFSFRLIKANRLCQRY